ncbi:hypothetical protein ENUP19_0205G0002 [Entamoeba nuttalli]|uniref:Uncharacterized protein n=2 Tax=Entamoeba nuttalli TaxID=412467 RepID=K2HC32_ENTNP|nr:hypothetical protein ENU1_096940 [Entamoeba nuttalli P19]EKE40249.1 hypothetical protein ENU1_096940 [Entamoeba nuttalli P19]|eukprot:XP_008857414.1 hypothetical protein ENU1_096940 [Entamoeba nuttalli P19]
MNIYYDSIKKKVSFSPNGITPLRYFVCFVLSNLPIIYLLYYVITLIVSMFNNEFTMSMGNRLFSLTKKSVMDPQNVSIITAILLSILSIIRSEKEHLKLLLPKLSILINYIVFYYLCKLCIKKLSDLLKDPMCQSFHSNYKSISSFSFATTFFFLVFSHLLSSSDSMETDIRPISYITTFPQYPPAPLSLYYQSIGPFSCRFSRCCEKLLFGMNCSYHFAMYHLLILYVVSSILTSNDMLENGNHSHQQSFYGVLLAYISMFIIDSIEFYCRPWFNSCMMVNVLYFIFFHITTPSKGLNITLCHLISLANGFLSFYIYRKSLIHY